MNEDYKKTDQVLTKHQYDQYRQLRLAGSPSTMEAFLAGKLTAYGEPNLDTDWINGLPEQSPIGPVDIHQQLKLMAETCKACELHKTRSQAVIGHGSLRAPVMIVGEAPGADEDQAGKPFVGAAGQAFFGDGKDDPGLLSHSGLLRKHCYVANTICCRPPGNAQPTPHQTDQCRQFLERQIALVRPLVLVALGIPAAKFLLGGLFGTKYTDWSQAKMREMRTFNTGTELPHWQGIPIISTYHPAAYLRDPDQYGPLIKEDMEILKAVLIEQQRVTAP